MAVEKFAARLDKKVTMKEIPKSKGIPPWNSVNLWKWLKRLNWRMVPYGPKWDKYIQDEKLRERESK
jgi:hypothetical protein